MRSRRESEHRDRIDVEHRPGQGLGDLERELARARKVLAVARGLDQHVVAEAVAQEAEDTKHKFGCTSLVVCFALLVGGALLFFYILRS